MLVDPYSRPDFPGDADADPKRCEDAILACTVAIRLHSESERLYIGRGVAWS